MDPREELSFPRSGQYHVQRGMARMGPGVHGSLGVSSITSMLEESYQANLFGSTLPPEHPLAISSQGVNVGAAPAVAQQAEAARRKRGRPRKYGPDGGGGVSLALSPGSSSRSAGSTPTGPIPTGKRGRGRPPGTGRKQQAASLGAGSAGSSFTPHVITVAGGEDIATKIMSFSQQSPRAICILSASGAVSAATLQQSSTSGGTVTYEGRFEILYLSGSYLPSDSGGSHGRTGGLSVCLASADGRVVGGGVGGVLIAASHVQVIVGCFFWGNSKTKNKSRENTKGAEELDLPSAGSDPDASAGFIQNLGPQSSVGIWPGSQSMDMHNTHIDIDLMRE